MEYDKNLSEISRLLKIPKHTLHYWEKEGLLHFGRNPNNNYRLITQQVIFDIDETINYRNMELSINEIRTLHNVQLDELDTILEASNHRLDEKIQKLKRAHQKVTAHRQRIAQVKELFCNPYQDEVPDFQRVVSYQLNQNEHWLNCIEQPYRFLLMISPDKPDVILEGIVDDNCLSGDLVLWRATAAHSHWKTFLLRTVTEHGHRKSNNVQTHLDALHGRGYQTGIILARYLAEATEYGMRTIYYKAWVQVNPQE